MALVHVRLNLRSRTALGVRRSGAKLELPSLTPDAQRCPRMRNTRTLEMLLKSINYWSFPGGLEGSLDVFEAMNLAKQHGFEAIELAIGDSGPSR